MTSPSSSPRRLKASTDELRKNAYAPSLEYDDLETTSVVDEHDQETAAALSAFHFNTTGLSSAEAIRLLAQHGRNELPQEDEAAWKVVGRLLFCAPMPIMIWIAIVVELVIANYPDAMILLVIQLTNAGISFYESMKAGQAIDSLQSTLQPTATVKRDGGWQVLDARTVVPGDLVLLGSGDAVPADCRINIVSGAELDVDQAALTGESLPVTFFPGDSVKMGSTVVSGEVEATVEYTGSDTFFGKTASLLQDHHELSHLQQILMRIMKTLVSLSLVLCTINLIYLLTFDSDVHRALSFTIVLLVASIPLALEIVTTTTLAIGSKQMAKHGAIVAKLSAIEDLAGMSILCSDKTGTLTLNQMVLQKASSVVYPPKETVESVLVMAALATKWKEPPRDALDRLTLGAVKKDLLDGYTQTDYLPFDPQIKRTESTVTNATTGEAFKVSKGAPHVILKLVAATSGMHKKVEDDVAKLGEKGIRSLAVARTIEGEWNMMGLLTFLDPPRPDTKETIQEAARYGITVKMITGDHVLIARNTARALDMGDKIKTADCLPTLDPETKAGPADLVQNYGNLCLDADGFAQVYPEHKFLIIECLREMKYTVGMTGDGVNDAPALKRADVGIAVAGATDAARAAADIVLTEEGLSAIVHGIEIAREIFQRISNFITYRIAATLQLLFFFFISMVAFHPDDYEQPPSEVLEDEEEWPEFFHMPVLMLMLITLLNDGTMVSIAYDYAVASPAPCTWNLPVLFIVSSVLGSVSCFSSLILLQILLNSWDPDGIIQRWGMEGVQYGEIVAALYLKVSVSDFLTLFSARTGERFFWKVPPGKFLLLGGAIALTISSILSIYWPDSSPDEVLTEGLHGNMGLFLFVWLYCILFWFVQDLLKVGTFSFLKRINFHGIMQSALPPDFHQDRDLETHDAENQVV